MRISSQAVFRLALVGCLSIAGSHLAPSVNAAASPEKTLPATTFFFVKVNNVSELRQAFTKTQMGQLIADPALKPMKDDVTAKLEETSKTLKDKVGVSLGQLLDLPQGMVWLAVMSKDDPKVPFAGILSADAGKNASSMENVLTKATKQAEESGSMKASTETFKDMTFHVLRSTKEGQNDEPPLIWTHQKSVYYISSDADALKDALAHADGRDDSLADSESFSQVRKKIGNEGQALWYLDLAQALHLITQVAGAQGGGAGAVEAQLQLLGINGLKAAGGALSLNEGDFDTRSKTFLLMPAPAQGVLKIFKLPPAKLRPEPWVPASVAGYATVSWDLDGAYKALKDLADMSIPGGLEGIEKQLAGPNGGGLDLQKDVFGPLGNRLTMLSVYKKPINEKSQKMLVGVALQDPKAFQNTLNKILDLTKASPKKREFQGSTIYDFDVAGIPGAPPGGVDGPVSLAVAKSTLFFSTDSALLEQAIRTGGPALADNAGFQAVAKQTPDMVSSLSFQKPEESARALYDLIKEGGLQKVLDNAKPPIPGAEVPKVGDVLDPAKLPEFSVFAKYFTQGGGYSVMDDDGFTMTRFTLRRVNP